MPMMPPAPPAFSMMNWCFIALPIDWARTRVSVSVGPPAAAGTTMTMGLFGYSWAMAVVVIAAKSMASQRSMVLILLGGNLVGDEPLAKRHDLVGRIAELAV